MQRDEVVPWSIAATYRTAQRNRTTMSNARRGHPPLLAGERLREPPGVRSVGDRPRRLGGLKIPAGSGILHGSWAKIRAISLILPGSSGAGLPNGAGDWDS